MRSHFLMLTPNEQKALDNALLTWGTLTRLELGGSLASLPQSTLHMLSTLGVKTSSSWQGLQWPHEAEQIDHLISKLFQVKPKWADAVKWHYIEPGDIRQKAKARGLPKSTHYDQFQHGRCWIGQEFFRLH